MPGSPMEGGFIYPWWLQAWVHTPPSPHPSGPDWPLAGGALLRLQPLLQIPTADLCCCQGFISHHAGQRVGTKGERVGKWPKLKKSLRALVAGELVPDCLLR